jgi:hypothetical protein
MEEEGRKAVYCGVIYLLDISDDKVEIIDWKMDLSKTNIGNMRSSLRSIKKVLKEYLIIK